MAEQDSCQELATIPFTKPCPSFWSSDRELFCTVKLLLNLPLWVFWDFDGWLDAVTLVLTEDRCRQAVAQLFFICKNLSTATGSSHFGGWPLAVAKLKDRSVSADHWPFHAEMNRVSLLIGRAIAENGLCRRSPDRHKIASVTPACYSASPLHRRPTR